jgi:hypothetical protein
LAVYQPPLPAHLQKLKDRITAAIASYTRHVAESVARDIIGGMSAASLMLAIWKLYYRTTSTKIQVFTYLKMSLTLLYVTTVNLYQPLEV